MVLHSGWGEKIFRRSHEWPSAHVTQGTLTEVDVKAVSAITGQRGIDLESSPSWFK